MRISRRTFVKGTLATPAAAIGVAGCGNGIEAAPIVDAQVNDDPTSARYGQIAIDLPEYPDLVPVGGAIMLRVAALAPGSRPFVVPDRGVLLVHRAAAGDPPEFVATRGDCPHQGCPLGYSAKDQLIECPCHSSRFLAVTDPNDAARCAGLVVHLPAMDNLTVYGVDQTGDTVYVDLTTDDSCGTNTALPPVVNGTITLPVIEFPSLGMVGGSLVGKPPGLADKLIVARTTATVVIALSAVCTHRGCTVALDAKDMFVRCPCHGSQFSYLGAVLSSPATRPLKQYTVAFDGSTIIITTS